MIQRRQPLEN